MPREGTKTKSAPTTQAKIIIEIRYAPGGDENGSLVEHHLVCKPLRLDMPREGTKTVLVQTVQLFCLY